MNAYMSDYLLEKLKDPEIQQSLDTILDNLPKLAEMTEMLTQTYDVCQNLTKDRVFVEDTIGGMKEFIQPLHQKAKEVASTVIEANDQAKSSTKTYGLLAVIKLLNDPQIQNILRFSEAYLKIAEEKKQHSHQ